MNRISKTGLTIVVASAIALGGASSAVAAGNTSVSASPEVDLQHDYLVVEGEVSSSRASCESGRKMTLKQINNSTGEKKLIGTDTSDADGAYAMGNFIDRSSTSYVVKAKATNRCDAGKAKFSI